MIVVFVDMDYFFAQVEEIMNPSLKGKPVAVCVFSGRSEDSGAVATSNYEARKLGIKAGIPIKKAKEISKDVVFLRMRKELYQQVSDRVMTILGRYADVVEVASIDEAYMDVTRRVRNFQEAIELALRAKTEIKEREGLSVSMGVAPNKVLAKVIADRNKPGGLGVIRPEEVMSFLENLDVGEIPGVGEVTERALLEKGINKLGQLRKVGLNELSRLVGKSKALYLLSLANNTFQEPVKPRERHHMGRYLTLPRNTRDPEEIRPFLHRAVEEAYKKVDGLPQEIYVIGIMEDLDIVSRGRSYTFALSSDRAKEEAMSLLMKLLEKDGRKLRRVGVRLGKVVKTSTLEDFLH
ncbi:nucleotidyltransferase/DNA polymerase involved in DNA repair [Metallosphaera yellowstonensis MK1]|jgi:DNA polymerase IV (DinB-like DNA polymerase)|uniref:DNA polymerase IV n=1 Tax=Metallosphaera yellowstonensis MK1 TaxID=671065 RepID=H2C2Y5_9CREN|nr:hypothetical protein [Metallosphaera yellowstonensis]EHP70606.1 nucleotidyltransferase/DNA polymerase involved in DNA repair [Metallosphaera yellowstonensis MK1]